MRRLFFGVGLVSAGVLLLVASSEAARERNVNRLDLRSAEQSLVKLSAGLKSVVGTSETGGLGVLMGGQAAAFLTDQFFIGLGGYGGVVENGETNGMGYGGALAGYENSFARSWYYNGTLLTGFGGGRSAGDENGGGLVLEPSLAVAKELNKGVRANLTAGYLLFPGIGSLSGFAASLNIEFKRFNLSFLE